MAIAPVTPSVKGLYINDYNTIVGNTTQENALLNWIQAKGINHVYCYDLNTICSTNAGRSALRALNPKLRQRGVIRIGGVGGSSATLIGTEASSRRSYNSGCSLATQKFDIFNLENEFWNYNGVSPFTQPGSNTALRFECNTTSDWNSQNTSIFNWGNTNGIQTDFYIGLIRDGKTSPATPPSSLKVPASTIANNLVIANDRILLSAYMTTAQFVQSSNSAFDRIKANLQLIGERAVAARKVTNVAIILHGGTSYMYSYFQTHTFQQAWTVLRNAFNASTGTWKNGINLVGYVIYGYQQVKNI
jgi:hypothetical protein